MRLNPANYSSLSSAYPTSSSSSPNSASFRKSVLIALSKYLLCVYVGFVFSSTYILNSHEGDSQATTDISALQNTIRKQNLDLAEIAKSNSLLESSHSLLESENTRLKIRQSTTTTLEVKKEETADTTNAKGKSEEEEEEDDLQLNSCLSNLEDLKFQLKSSTSTSSNTQKTGNNNDGITKAPTFKNTGWKGVSPLNSLEFISSTLATGGIELGIPFPKANTNDLHGLVLHHSNSLPDAKSTSSPPLSTSEALKNCDEVDVVITKGGNAQNQCLVVLEGYQGYHVHRFIRVTPSEKVKKRNGANSADRPLIESGPATGIVQFERVSRGQSADGKDASKPPTLSDSRRHWSKLTLFLNHADAMAARLSPVLKRISKTNTVVVMVCNAGVIELLVNWVCSARAKGIDVSNVLVFATDPESKRIVEELGLEVFSDEEGGFGAVPTEEARSYGDQTFVSMMYIKVLGVYLPMMLGYNVLFQDVDVVWNEDPVPYFLDSSRSGNFDTYFMDDGARSLRYAPYSANSGFYFLKNNDKTLYLITSLLYAGDTILKSKSHQQSLTTLLTEYNSLYGLTVKTLSTDNFPGGKTFHHDKPYMKQWMGGKREADPIIFHICWTLNKDDKLSYLEQLGLWYLNDGYTGGSLRDGSKAVSGSCRVVPVPKCHYKDKPSKIDCKESPSRDAGRGSW